MQSTSGAEARRCLVVVGTLVRGGAERQALLTAAALGSRGHDALVHVIAPPLSQEDDARELGVELDLPDRRLRLFAQVARLRRTVRAYGPDAVITFLSSASLRFLFLQAMGAHAPRPVWIASERGHAHAATTLRSPLRSLLRAAYLKAADRVVVNSAALAANVLGFAGSLGRKIEVVPNVLTPFEADPARAVEAVRALIGRGDRWPILGTLGSFHEDRNHTLLGEAFALLLKRYPRAQLAVIGRTTTELCAPSAARFRAQLERLGIAEHVTLAGEIPGARAFIPALDLFVLTSGLEGSSNALAEALLAGVAIATTPVADAEALLGGAGVLSSGWTPSAFERAMLEALERREYWRERALARARQLVAERGLSTAGASWSRVIEDASAERARRSRVNGSVAHP